MFHVKFQTFWNIICLSDGHFFFENDNVYGLKYIQAFVTIEAWSSKFSILIHNAFFFFVMEEFLWIYLIVYMFCQKSCTIVWCQCNWWGLNMMQILYEKGFSPLPIIEHISINIFFVTKNKLNETSKKDFWRK